MDIPDLPAHLTVRSKEFVHPMDYGVDNSNEYDVIMISEGDTRVYYQRHWIQLEDYLLLDPRTRSEEDQEIILEALKQATSYLAHTSESVGIGPSDHYELLEWIHKARHERQRSV